MNNFIVYLVNQKDGQIIRSYLFDTQNQAENKKKDLQYEISSKRMDAYAVIGVIGVMY